MATNLGPPTHLGLLSKLPAELREKIYRYHLLQPESVPMIPRITPSSFATHMADCKTNSHIEDLRTGSLECINRISGEIRLIGSPSCLALLSTSKTIYNEAVHIYYSKNHLTFSSVASLQNFIISCRSRYRFMEEISLRYCLVNWNSDIFRVLTDCHHLRIMRIQFHYHWTSFGDNVPLVNAAGMDSLRKVRGIKTLELSGKDHINIDGGKFEEVDIDDPRAIGPILRSELTRPRE